MLRITVIALLLGNILLAAFHATQASPDPAPEPQPAKLRPDPNKVPPMRLLSEMHWTEIPPAGLDCYSAGPFETETSRAAVEKQLMNSNARYRLRESEALVELGYWVSLQPAGSFNEAGEAMKELNKAGIEEIAVVTDADGAFRVSLGYYLDGQNARIRRDQVRDLGFEAETRLQREAQPRFWLDYQQPRGEFPAAMELPARIPQDKHREIACPQAGFASS